MKALQRRISVYVYQRVCVCLSAKWSWLKTTEADAVRSHANNANRRLTSQPVPHIDYRHSGAKKNASVLNYRLFIRTRRITTNVDLLRKQLG